MKIIVKVFRHDDGSVFACARDRQIVRVALFKDSLLRRMKGVKEAYFEAMVEDGSATQLVEKAEEQSW